MQPQAGAPSDRNQNDLEIYKQKYENFRHFDRLRWQMPGIALAIGAGVVAVAIRSEPPPSALALIFMLTATGAFVCAYAMHRIRARLEENLKALIEVAARIGDFRVAIPELRSGTRALQIFLLLVSLCCLVLSIVFALRLYGIKLE